VKVASRFTPFGTEGEAPAADLAQLHAALLPGSPIALLGGRFMKKFYYRILPREGVIFGAVAYVDECPAGFIVATDDPAGFMRSGLRRSWPYLIWVLGGSVLLTPKSVMAILEAAKVMHSRPRARGRQNEGEILSFGVAPEYREARFIRQTGLRLSHDLLVIALDLLRAKKIRLIRATVSADNTPAKLFYSGLGWSFEATSAPGWRHPTVQFVGRV
jgi:ribosomal protein S18 acetylase RimI-like enzyme